MPRYYASAWAGIAVWFLAGIASAQGQPASAPAPSIGADGMAQAVSAVVQRKCAQCHGPQVATPPKGFGSVTDAPRLVQSGKVVPGKPEGSPLFQMISSGKMPPPKARNGALTPEEVEVVRAWIVAGAPAWKPLPSAASAPAQGPQAGQDRSFQGWAGRIGKFHLQLVHFPIALLLAALVAELLNRLRPSPERRWASRFCLWLGAIGAALTAATGWLLSLSRDWSEQEEDLLDPHEWLGTTTAILSLALVAAGGLLLRRGTKAGWIYFTGLVALGVVVSLAGHFGGLLAWGEDFFAW